MRYQEASPYGFEPPESQTGYDFGPPDYEPSWIGKWFAGQPEWVFIVVGTLVLAGLWAGFLRYRRDLFKSGKWWIDAADRELIMLPVLTVAFVVYVLISLLSR